MKTQGVVYLPGLGWRMASNQMKSTDLPSHLHKLTNRNIVSQQITNPNPFVHCGKTESMQRPKTRSSSSTLYSRSDSNGVM
jgi:hypothetical protein